MSSGIFNVGSYQVAGHPFITGGVLAAGEEHRVSFPAITSRIMVQVYDNSGSSDHVRVHFAPQANNSVISGKHWWHVGKDSNQSHILDVRVKCKEVYISHDTGSSVQYQVFAELTNISANEMYALTGSGISSRV